MKGSYLYVKLIRSSVFGKSMRGKFIYYYCRVIRFSLLIVIYIYIGKSRFIFISSLHLDKKENSKRNKFKRCARYFNFPGLFRVYTVIELFIR